MSWRGPIPPLLVFVAALGIIATHYGMTWGMYQLCVSAAKEAIDDGTLDFQTVLPQQGGRLCRGLWDEVKEARASALDILLAVGLGGAATASSLAMSKKRPPARGGQDDSPKDDSMS